MSGCIAAGSPLTVQAGVRAFELGGNAVDACVAAKIMAGVAEPLLTGLGGAGIAMVRHHQDVHVVDFVTAMPGLGRAPGQVPAMDEVVLDFGPTTQAFHVGPSSVAVPGMPYGLWELHERFGRVDLRKLVEPALHACVHGAPVTAGFEEVGGLLFKIQECSDETRRLFAGRSGHLKEGETFLNPDLADVIEEFSTDGPDVFRSGDVGRAMVSAVGEGLLTIEDLAAYDVHLRDPLTVGFQGADVYLPGTPSTGGPQIGLALEALPDELAAWPRIESTIALAQAMDAAEQRMGSGFTTHVSCVDQEGGTCSITSSLGETAGRLAGRTGLLINNFLGEEDVNPPGTVTPAGARMRTMMAPSLIVGTDRVLTMGSGGSTRIRSAVLHAIVRLLAHDASPEDAANGPRCHMEGGVLRTETYGRPLGYAQQVAARFPNHVAFPVPSMFFGGVHIAGLVGSTFVGAGDRRRSGSVGLCNAAVTAG
ncbi:MAG: hypothetical protein GY913_06270 [Proteobacteria bacterium]|nr:hypothetical protein [Pseudomonadota bacterium]MCP4916512.1 hypothetical protein [Pseudomonadota bacterium]